MMRETELDPRHAAREGAKRRRLAGALALILMCLASIVLALPLSASGKAPRSGLSKNALQSLPGAPQNAAHGLPYETGPSPETHDPATRGGPDQFGYIFEDEQESGGPVFSWQPGANRIADTAWQKIVNTGATTLDDGVITDTLPFSFSFYGTSYNSVHISTNGNVHFGPPSDWFPSYTYACLPSANSGVPQGMIAPLWYDFVVPASGGTGGVYTTVVGTAPNRTYLVEWRRVTKYADPSTYGTFEVLLDENGTIRYQYNEIVGTDTGGAGGVIGIQNISGTVGLPYSCYRNSVFPNRAIRYHLRQAAIFSPSATQQGGAPGSTVLYYQTLANQTGIDNSFTISASGNAWTSTVEPATTGVVPNGSSVPVTVSVQIPAGAHLGSSDVVTVSVSSALPSPGTYTATAVLTTSVSSNGADFGPPEQTRSGNFGRTVIYTALLTNTSPVTNQYHIVTEDSHWPTTASPAETGSLAPDQSTTITVSVRVPAGSTLGDSDMASIAAIGVVTTPAQYLGFTALTTTAGIWSERSPMPISRSRSAGVYFPGNGHIYAIGGSTTGGSGDIPIEEYDVASNRWQARATLPIPVNNVNAAAIGNAIYIPGGYNPLTGQAVSVLQVYYPLQNQVVVLTNSALPLPRMGAGVAAANGKLYVIGGADNSLVGTSTTLEYNPSHSPSVSGWTQKAGMRHPRVYLAAASVDNIIYAAGGMPGAPTDLDVVEKFNPLANTWTGVTSMNQGRAGLALVGIDSGQQGCGGRLYALGGGWNNYTASVERLDVTTDSGAWQMASPMDEPRRSLGAAFDPNTHSIFAFGGWNDSYEVILESAPCSGGPFPPAPTPTATVTPCPMNFSDVVGTDYFYQAVRYLFCEGAISGYSDNTFRPYNYTTRGQLSKIVVNAQGWAVNTSGGPHFSDVPSSNPFYAYIETAYHHSVISGYADGTFRWGNNVTRSQLCKIVVVAKGWQTDTTNGPHFTDVPATHPFYAYIETAFNKAIISGYADDTFRPGLPATRGQISKIVYNAVTSP